MPLCKTRILCAVLLVELCSASDLFSSLLSVVPHASLYGSGARLGQSTGQEQKLEGSRIRMAEMGSDKVTHHIDVPVDAIGVLLGKNQFKLNSMQKDSGAKMVLDKQPRPENEVCK